MKKLKKPDHSLTCNPFISSDCVNYTGPELQSVDYCEDDKLSDILSKFDCLLQESLKDKEELYNKVNLACYKEELRKYQDCHDCNDDYVMVSYLNFVFQKLCDIEKNFGSATQELSFELDWCLKDEQLTCDVNCLFKPLVYDEVNEKKTLTEILKRLVQRANSYWKEICDLKLRMDDFENIEIPVIPDILTVIPPCEVYIPLAESYVSATDSLDIDEGVETLWSDYCFHRDQILGRVEDRNNAALSFTCENENGVFTEITNKPTSESNSFEMIRYIAQEMCRFGDRIQAIEATLAWCCNADCDRCLDTFFTVDHVNYSSISGNVSTSTVKPTIWLDITLNTDIPRCSPQEVLGALSYITISDGTNSASIPLNELINVNLPTTLFEDIPIVVSDYELDYTKDITIRMRIITDLGCEQTYRAVVRGWSNPKVCRTCKLCIAATDTTTPLTRTTGDCIEYIIQSTVSNKPRDFGILCTDNPCRFIELEENEIVTVTVTNPLDGFHLITDCPEIRGDVSLMCDDSPTIIVDPQTVCRKFDFSEIDLLSLNLSVTLLPTDEGLPFIASTNEEALEIIKNLIVLHTPYCAKVDGDSIIVCNTCDQIPCEFSSIVLSLFIISDSDNSNNGPGVPSEELINYTNPCKSK